jgi:hypothetical protein
MHARGQRVGFRLVKSIYDIVIRAGSSSRLSPPPRAVSNQPPSVPVPT